MDKHSLQAKPVMIYLLIYSDGIWNSNSVSCRLVCGQQISPDDMKVCGDDITSAFLNRMALQVAYEYPGNSQPNVCKSLSIIIAT